MIADALGRENAFCYLLGDFIINFLAANKHNTPNEVINLFLSFCFVPLIDRPTRVTEHSASLIDNIFTNAITLDESEKVKSGILFTDISDHFPVFHIRGSKLIPSKSGRTTYKYIINDHTINSLKLKLSQQDWGDVIKCNDVNIGFKNLNKKIENCYKESIPVKKVNVKLNHKPWVTNGLMNSIKYKNKLYIRYINNPCDNT